MEEKVNETTVQVDAELNKKRKCGKAISTVRFLMWMAHFLILW